MLGFKSSYAEYVQFNAALDVYLTTLGTEALWLKRCSVALVSTLAARHVLCPINDNDSDETLIRLTSVMEMNAGATPDHRGVVKPAVAAATISGMARKIKAFILKRTDKQVTKMLNGLAEPLDIVTALEKTFLFRRRREVKLLFSETADRLIYQAMTQVLVQHLYLVQQIVLVQYPGLAQFLTLRLDMHLLPFQASSTPLPIPALVL
ncbi:hypothetical protein CJU90_3167 [Yarrowia sp. C11]|nr:hypothetical protein CKK34_4616 [Yarrowia sp. E02]KAG5369676.1 hypothetical protein CJU90_3167 [Yarrowia sp. C11]